MRFRKNKRKVYPVEDVVRRIEEFDAHYEKKECPRCRKKKKRVFRRTVGYHHYICCYECYTEMIREKQKRQRERYGGM